MDGQWNWLDSDTPVSHSSCQSFPVRFVSCFSERVMYIYFRQHFSTGTGVNHRRDWWETLTVCSWGPLSSLEVTGLTPNATLKLLTSAKLTHRVCRNRPHLLPSKPFKWNIQFFPDTGCKEGWLGFGRHCYKFNYEVTSWEQARSRCQLIDAQSDLVYIDNYVEQKWIQGFNFYITIWMVPKYTMK